MKLALIGYGKMGKAIHEIAKERGHEAVLIIDADNLNELTPENIKKADVVIEFTSPHTAFKNVTFCLQQGVPVVCGSTGWLEKLDEAKAIAEASRTGLIVASNFSVGVNIFFELNAYLAKMMANLKEYKVSMEEIHHTQKLDAPSGTAISLAEGIIANSGYTNWTMESPTEKQIHIEAKRIENIPGTHSIFYDSAVDQIEIKHTAHSREGFALGAVIAAEWLANKKGIFTMKDVLSLNS